MGFLADSLAQANQNVAALPQQDTLGQSLRKGWSSGLDSLGANVGQLAGLAGEAAGADQFAQGAYGMARGLRESAQMNGPQIQSLDQVDGVGNALRWGVGQLGAMGPIALGITGASLATGNPLVGGALAMGVPEAGDIAYRQTEDPQAMEQSAGSRLLQAGIGGAASGAVQSVGPGMFLNKFGAGAGDLVKRSAGNIVGRNMAESVGVNAAGGAAGEGIKQFAANQAAPLDMGAIGEAGLVGGIMGVPFGAAGAAVDLAKSSPGKAWQGTKNVANSAAQSVQGAVDPAWQSVQQHAVDGMTYAKGLKDKTLAAMPEVPENVKAVAEFMTQGFQDRADSVMAAYKDLKDADDLPAEVKAKVVEAGKAMGNRANQAYIWSVKTAREGMGAAKDVWKGEDGEPGLGQRLRDLSKPLDDTADRIMKSQPWGDLKEFAAAQGDRLNSMFGKSEEYYTEWTRKKAKELSEVEGLPEEHVMAAARAHEDPTNLEYRAELAKIVKGRSIAGKIGQRLDALIKGVKDGIEETKGAKKSEDYGGYDRLIWDKVGPILEDMHPEFLSDNRNINKLGALLREFTRSIAVGNQKRQTKIYNGAVRILGEDVAHAVFDASHEFLTDGESGKANTLAKIVTEGINNRKEITGLEDTITKNMGEQASERTGVTSDPHEIADVVRRWSRGEFARGTPEQARLADVQMRDFLQKHFGTKADVILAAASKEIELEGGRPRGNTEGKFDDSDEHFVDNGDGEDASGSEYGTTSERDGSVRYHGQDREEGTPHLYVSPAAHNLTSTTGFESAVEQQIKKHNVSNPEDKAYFVPLKDYAKARGWTKEQIESAAKGHDPSEVGFLKYEKMHNDDRLEDWQLRKMRGQIASKNHPDAIGVKGRTISYDSRRIANVMHESSRGEWTDFENSGGMRTRLASKFAEGIAKLTKHENPVREQGLHETDAQYAKYKASLERKELELRDNHVIGSVDGKPLTWGEARALLARQGGEKLTKDEVALRNQQDVVEAELAKVPAKDRRAVEAGTKKGPDAYVQAAAQLKRMQDHASNMAHLKEMPNDELMAFESKIMKQLDDRKQQIHDAVYDELKLEGHRSKAEFKAELAARKAARSKEESSGIPARQRVLAAIDSAREQQSGEDVRSTVMDTGMETRDGIEIGKTAKRGADGYAGKSVTFESDTPPPVFPPHGKVISEVGPQTTEAAPRNNPTDAKVDALIDRFTSAPWRRGRAAAPSSEFPRVGPQEDNGAWNAQARMEGAMRQGKSDVKALWQEQKAKQKGDHVTVLGESIRGAETELKRLEARIRDEENSDVRKAMREEADILAADLKEMKDKDLATTTPETLGSGRTEGDRRGQIHDAAALFSQKQLQLNDQQTGGKNPLTIDHGPQIRSLEKRLKIEGITEERKATIEKTLASLKAEQQTMTDLGRDTLRMKIDRMKQSAVKATREAGAKLEELSRNEHRLDPEQKQQLATLMYVKADNAKQSVAMIERLHKSWSQIKEQDELQPNDLVDESVGSTPNPKAVAAKKAAFLERAASGDAALHAELGKSTDAKGLQRAVDALNNHDWPDIKNDQIDHLSKTIDIINERLSVLVQDPDVALGMQGKKYSLKPPETEYSKMSDAEFMAHAEERMDAHDRVISETPIADRESTPAYVEAMAENERLGAEMDRRDPPDNTPFEYTPAQVRHAQREYYDERVRQAGLIDSIARANDKKDSAALERLSGELVKSTEWLAQQIETFGKYQMETGYSNYAAETGKKSAKGGMLSGMGADKDRIRDIYQKTLEEVRGIANVNQLTGMLRAKEKRAEAYKPDYSSQSRQNGRLYDTMMGEAQAMRDRIAELGGKRSQDATQANRHGPMAPAEKQAVLDHIQKTLGQSVMVDFPFLPHAGEFEYDPNFGTHVIRVSNHALNPTTVAYHESLHAFFQQLRAKGIGDIATVVEKAASSPAVMNQLKKLLAHSPDAIKQLGDAEERAAYMYQFWARGDLKLGPQTHTVFQKLANWFKKVMGVWTNDERATEIMRYFHDGDYAKNMGDKNAVWNATMERNTNGAWEKTKGMTGSLRELGDAVFSAGSSRLRDSGIPALSQLADMVKKRGTDEGGDAGFLPAARIARADFMGRWGESLRGATEASMAEALEALQRGKVPTSSEARSIHFATRKILDDVYKYLGKAGVRVNDLGVGTDYFPRQWDANYLSKHKEEFMAMARKYPEWYEPESTYNRLIGADGAELPTVDRPGMQSKKARVLDFISHEDAAPFMNKNLPQIINSYVTQATRRGEWARRFKDDNSGFESLLGKARVQGATKEMIDHAQQYIQGVNGTLGDDLNPTLRRYMGNMVVYQNIRLLPLAFFSSLVDPAGIVVRGGSVGDAWSAFKRGIREIPAGLKGQQINDYWTDMAQTLGVIDNAALQHSLGALYTQGVVGDNAKKINDTFFRFNLMEQFNQSMRVSATEAGLKFMQKHADGKASQHSGRWMNEIGLQPGDIRVVNGRVATSVAEGLSEAQAARVKSAVNQWVDGAILRPDAADKPTWMNDPHWMLVAHLKQFVYAFHHTILDRVVHEFKNGNYSPAMAMASYVPIMLAADTLKGFIQGGGSQPSWKDDWGPAEHLGNAMERAGLFGTAQFGVDALQGNLGSLTGPSLEQFADAVSVLNGHAQFKPFALHSLPANALYSNAFGAGQADPTFAD